MDWYLRGDDRAAVRALRHSVAAYLRRHVVPGSDTGDAELVVEELVGNAARRAGGPVWVSVAWAQTEPTVTVRDLGPGFDPSRLAPLSEPQAADGQDHDGARWFGGADLDPELPEGGGGLFLVSHLSEALQVQARQAGGTTVSATLALKRPAAVDHDPPRQTTDALPTLAEAGPDGGFGKESFLRALVVQLARTVEFQHGPDAAEAAVAQVGADIGGRMEEEFRLARRVVGRMSPQEVAECLVRLKHAIDGGFFVVEADQTRIVLGNDRCPFGEVVRLAPSLCRMTSSVFGGIAARNSQDGAAVVLEERIAVGDRGCRVVVHLQRPSPAEEMVSHRYAAPG